MSYRDLRNFTEMMRALGYPRLISMENFRTPNFPLVAEILSWLINRYDPTADLPVDVDTEQDRVIFIKCTAQFLATKAHLKMNTKRLYSADGYAVKELLKVSSLLYTAMRSNKLRKSSSASVLPASSSFDISALKVTDLKACRQLASEITTRGAKLFDLLGKEVDLREERKGAISRSVDIDQLENGIKQNIVTVTAEIGKVTHMIDNLASDEANLAVKIEKKRQDLERNQKRLKSLASVRPAFMDEYERHEAELAKQYAVYMEKHCNLCYLEHQLELHHKVERGKVEEAENSLKKVQMRMAEAEKKMIQDEVISDDLLMVAASSDLLQSRSSVDVEPNAEGPKVTGSMGGGMVSDDDDSETLSSESDVDDEKTAGHAPEEEDDFGSDEDF